MNTSRLLRITTLPAAFAVVALLSINSMAFAGNDAGTASGTANCHPQGMRQSYSYQPMTFHAGDKVVVSADHANLMKGMDTVATVNKGQAFDILKVQGPWLGAEIEMDGKKLTGWIWSQQVVAVNQPSPSAPDQTARAMPQQQERRSFSYEPSYSQPPVYRSYRNYSSPKKAPWQYPKTDPRRYGNGL